MSLSLSGTAGVTYPDGSVAAVAVPAGSVVQVVSTTKTDSFTVASTSYTDITGLSVTLTPSSASNKLLIFGFVSAYPTTSDASLNLAIDVNGSLVGSAAAAGSRSTAHTGYGYDNSSQGLYRIVPLAFNYLYSLASASSHTVKIRIMNGDTGNNTLYVNRSQDDGDFSYNTRQVSTITVMEIKG